MSKIIVVIETRIELPNDDNPVISIKNDRLIN
jgi:hypothetical protein